MNGRAVSPGLEKILGEKFSVLDHGFVRILDYMGDDSSIVRAARVSYGKGTKTVREDRQLINYLMCHGHTGPFEMCEGMFHLKLPFFVARQLVRHRTASVNEISGRYSVLENECYIPDVQDIHAQSTLNKQGRGESLTREVAAEVRSMIQASSDRNNAAYQEILDRHVSREIARFCLPLNLYTELYWKIDVRNLLGFLQLRVHQSAQYEMRCYAHVLLRILECWLPYTYEAFKNYQLDSEKLSAEELRLLRDKLHGKVSGDYHLTKRERSRFAQIFGYEDAETIF